MRPSTSGKKYWFTAAAVLLSVLVANCTQAFGGRASRLSGAVAFPNENTTSKQFVSNPGIGYVKAYLQFEPELADDVIMFVDQELLEGLTKHRWVKGGDWMALVGIQRSGALWVAGGTEKTHKGKPSKDRNWKIYNLHQRLQPNQWYQVEIVADFAKREFVSFHIKGTDLERTIDLSGIQLDYPNHMPFDRASMIYIVGAMRGRSMMTKKGKPIIYFDDIEGGIVLPDKTKERLFFDDFESQTVVGKQPIIGSPILLSNYKFNHWYLERDESLIRIEKKPFARSGNSVGVVDVNLD